MNTADAIREKAFGLGFSRVGFTSAGPLIRERNRLKEWLDRGYHGTMQWMERGREKRGDPSVVVPGAQSVISLAMNYYSPARHTDGRGTGKISRYAWGDDYHDILGEKLEELWKWMEKEFPGVRGRWYVDTGPVMEKVWAQRAGIGWIGKHSNLITKDLGSWVFLGEVITTLEVEYDRPETDHCGSCTLCLEACPTQAIVEPYVVDSVRCISYLTIEHRGPLQTDADFDRWIYGCDTCQDVCPWNNKFQTETEDPRFGPRDGNVTPPLREWSQMTDAAFRRRFRGSPVTRTKLAGLLRNIRHILRREAASDPFEMLSASNNEGRASEDQCGTT